MSFSTTTKEDVKSELLGSFERHFKDFDVDLPSILETVSKLFDEEHSLYEYLQEVTDIALTELNKLPKSERVNDTSESIKKWIAWPFWRWKSSIESQFLRTMGYTSITKKEKELVIALNKDCLKLSKEFLQTAYPRPHQEEVLIKKADAKLSEVLEGAPREDLERLIIEFWEGVYCELDISEQKLSDFRTSLQELLSEKLKFENVQDLSLEAMLQFTESVSSKQ